MFPKLPWERQHAGTKVGALSYLDVLFPLLLQTGSLHGSIIIAVLPLAESSSTVSPWLGGVSLVFLCPLRCHLANKTKNNGHLDFVSVAQHPAVSCGRFIAPPYFKSPNETFGINGLGQKVFLALFL